MPSIVEEGKPLLSAEMQSPPTPVDHVKKRLEGLGIVCNTVTFGLGELSPMWMKFMRNTW
jgi:hypothetical protein